MGEKFKSIPCIAIGALIYLLARKRCMIAHDQVAWGLLCYYDYVAMCTLMLLDLKITREQSYREKGNNKRANYQLTAISLINLFNLFNSQDELEYEHKYANTQPSTSP